MIKENKGNVVLCYPVMQGSGCKYTATNIAHFYKATYTDKKVALVDFDFKAPYLASLLSSHDDVHGIDNLIDKIDGGFLTEDLFKENMIKLKDGVELLKGTKLIGNHKIFSKNHIDTIVKHLRSLYDFIIVSVSPESDNAGTVYGLFEADNVVVVGRNNMATLKHLDRAISIVNQYKGASNNIKFLYNMYNENCQLDFSVVAKKYDLTIVGAIKYDEATIDNGDINSSVFKIFKGKGRNAEAYEAIIKGLSGDKE